MTLTAEIKMTMMTIRKIFLTLTLIAIPLLIYSKGDDFGIWTGVNVKHKIVKKLDAKVSGALRTFDNNSKIDQSYLEGGLEYDFNKYISVSGSYRLISKLEDNSEYYFRHKLFIDLKGTLPAGRFDLSLRARIQRTTKTYIEDEEDLISKYFGRLKLKAGYNTPSFPINPFISCEFFSPDLSDRGFGITKNRFAAGGELKLTKKTSLEAGYIFQRDYKPHISDIHIFSIDYNIKF